MIPAEVPAELVETYINGEFDGPIAATGEQHVRYGLAAVLSEHERQVREQVAKEIEAYTQKASEKFVEEVLADKAGGFSGVLRASAIAWTAKFVRGEVS